MTRQMVVLETDAEDCFQAIAKILGRGAAEFNGQARAVLSDGTICISGPTRRSRLYPLKWFKTDDLDMATHGFSNCRCWLDGFKTLEELSRCRGVLFIGGISRSRWLRVPNRIEDMLKYDLFISIE